MQKSREDPAFCSLAFSDDVQIEPSDSQMQSAFTQYLYEDATAKISKIEFVRFKKEPQRRKTGMHAFSCLKSLGL
jgi:hypothetical protein